MDEVIDLLSHSALMIYKSANLPSKTTETLKIKRSD